MTYLNQPRTDHTNVRRGALLALLLAMLPIGCGGEDDISSSSTSTTSAGGSGGEGGGGGVGGGDGAGGGGATGSGGMGGQVGGMHATVPARRLSLGHGHACLAHAGSVYCWGTNDFGKLGDGTTEVRDTPTEVAGLSTAVSVSSASSSSAALLVDGTVRTWGNGHFGLLGNGDIDTSGVPVTTQIANVATVAMAGNHGCALLEDNTIQCWGKNGFGQLGNGTVGGPLDYSDTPVTVVEIDNAIDLSAADDHACALLADGTVACWGSNMDGQLGNGTTLFGGVAVPGQVIGISNAVAVAVGFGFSCALLDDGTVSCWGRAVAVSPDNGLSEDSNIPVTVPELDDVVQIAAGSSHRCAIKADGTLRCWGSNFFGQLGDGTKQNNSVPIPVAVIGLTNVVEVSAGGLHTCALRDDDSLWCWGHNTQGYLGDGTTESSYLPVPIPLP